MNRISKHAVQVLWGDCDPANIVFRPNYFAWFDADSRASHRRVRSLRSQFEIAGSWFKCLPVRRRTIFLRPIARR